jgi:C-terminal processing protease CtpA/Prc
VELSAGLPVSGLRASIASWRVFEQDGRRLAYVHLWNLLSPELPRLVKDALGGGASYAEGLVIDLRGRGGQVGVMQSVLELLRSNRRPLVLLIDRETRSAKEILAFRMRGRAVLVGERTAGAVLPGECRQLSGGAMVMLPVDSRSLNRLTSGGALEGRGVDPDLPVTGAGPYSAGADPILEAGIRVVLEKLHDLPRRRRL